MKSLLVLIFIQYIYNNQITTLSKSLFYSGKIYDVYMSTSSISYLTNNKIVKKNYNLQGNEYNLYANLGSTSTTTAKDVSSLVEYNGGYFVACTTGYLVASYAFESNVFTIKSVNNTSYNANYKCSIAIVNGYFGVSIIGDDKKLHLHIFQINNDLTFSSHATYSQSTAINCDKCSYTCVGMSLSLTKINCFYINSRAIKGFIYNISDGSNIEDSIGNTNQVSELKITRSGIDKYMIFYLNEDVEDQQYYSSLTYQNGEKENIVFSSIMEGLPSSIVTYSGYVISNNQYYPVYYDENFINIEKVIIEGEERTDLFLSYDFIHIDNTNNKIINTYTNVYNGKFYIIALSNSNSYLYTFEYPTDITCTPDTFTAGPNGNSYDVVERLHMEYPDHLNGFDMEDGFYEVNNGAGASVDSSTYIATFSGLELGEQYQMMFMFKDTEGSIYYNHKCSTDVVVVCHDRCQSCEVIPNDLTGHPTKCLECKSTFYPLVDVVPKDCYQSNEDAPGYYYDSTASLFKKCYQSCATCTGAGTDSDMKCNTCKSSYTLLKDSSNKISCLTCDVGGNPSYDSSIQQTQYIYESASDCPPTKQKYVSSQKLCYKDCPNTFPYYDSITKECGTSCPSDRPFIIINTCVTECPENSQLKSGNEYECECIYESYTVDSDGSIICDLISNIQLYEVILSDECKNKLMNANSITDENNLIIEKKVVIRKNEILNQLEYKIYKKNGDVNVELDSSICEGMEVTLITPIDLSYKGLDIDKIKATKKENYDIFNPKDDFFNNICSKYTDENGADVPIKIRRQEYYQEFPLCENTCTYNQSKILENDITVECICKYKSYSSDSRTFSVIETESDFKKKDISNSNFKTMKCGSETFKNVGKNSAFWLILFGLLVQICVFTIFIIFKKKIIGILLLDAFGLILASPPKEDEEKKKITEDHKSQNEDNNVKIYGEEKDKESNNEVVLEDEKISHDGLNNMNFQNALEYDKRGFLSYYINILMYNQMLLFVIFKDNWNFVITKISMFVNIITFALLFNVMFFGNKLIKAIYENKGGLSMKNAIGWIFLSSFLTVVLNCIAKFFGLTKRDVDNAKKDPNFNKEEFSDLIFKRTIIYFIVCLVFTFFIWYFGMSFCAIYSKCQKNLIFYIFMTWLFIMIYPFILCAIVTLFRYIGLKKKIKAFYTISKGIQWIIML